MAILENDISIKSTKPLLQNFMEIITRDKKKKVPVIKFIRHGFLFDIAERINKKRKEVKFIGITGESASGKSTFVRTLTKKIQEIEANNGRNLLNFISADNYFCDISEKIKLHGSFDAFLINENYNPDAPESFQLDLMREDFLKLAKFEAIDIPEYKIDSSGRSIPKAIHIEKAPIILTEGIAVFYPKVRDLFDVRVYVEVDDDIRLQRYISRAISNRNQTKDDAIQQYKTVNESAKIHIRPQRKFADIIINGNAFIEDIEQLAEDFSRCF